MCQAKKGPARSLHRLAQKRGRGQEEGRSCPGPATGNGQDWSRSTVQMRAEHSPHRVLADSRTLHQTGGQQGALLLCQCTGTSGSPRQARQGALSHLLSHSSPRKSGPGSSWARVQGDPLVPWQLQKPLGVWYRGTMPAGRPGSASGVGVAVAQPGERDPAEPAHLRGECHGQGRDGREALPWARGPTGAVHFLSEKWAQKPRDPRSAQVTRVRPSLDSRANALERFASASEGTQQGACGVLSGPWFAGQGAGPIPPSPPSQGRRTARGTGSGDAPAAHLRAQLRGVAPGRRARVRRRFDPRGPSG